MNSTEQLTWLNGRAANLIVYHNGTQHLIWEPSMGIAIEDAINIFCKRYNIDWEKEIDT